MINRNLLDRKLLAESINDLEEYFDYTDKEWWDSFQYKNRKEYDWEFNRKGKVLFHKFIDNLEKMQPVNNNLYLDGECLKTLLEAKIFILKNEWRKAIYCLYRLGISSCDILEKTLYYSILALRNEDDINYEITLKERLIKFIKGKENYNFTCILAMQSIFIERALDKLRDSKEIPIIEVINYLRLLDKINSRYNY
ncbi:hypothetical protein [Clostridium perfringens]|uniref:hypothetical protein n=1 Tax=Clostridium perfringens TaxID=1502 RepID=UPI0024BD0320|nr:hypothetical protein [Clostridium perfringens]